MASPVTIDTTYLGKYPELGRGPMPSVQGLVVHHTGADTSVQSVINGWVGSKGATGAQFVMDRSGKVYQILPDGTRANQTIKSWNPNIPWASNSTTQGIEIMAKDDKDVTPAQAAALVAFAKQQAAKYGYDPATHVVGHGEINGNGAPKGTPGTYLRQPTEGMTAVNALRADLSGNPASGVPNGNDWASAFAGTAKPTSAVAAINTQAGPPPIPHTRPDAAPPFQMPQLSPATQAQMWGQHSPPPLQLQTPADTAAFYNAVGTPSLPLQMGMAQPPHSMTPASATAPPPLAPQTNSKGYEIGKVYTMANGATFEAQPDGSFTKVASTPRAPTAIQTLIEASKPGVMSTVGTLVNDAKNAGPATVDAAKGAAASIGSAASGLGSLVGGLFNHSAPPPLPASTAYHAPPPSPTPSSAYHSTSNAGDSLAFNPVPHGPSINDGLTVPSFDAWMQNGQMRPLLTPNANANFDPPPNNYGTPGYSGNSGYGPASYAPAVPKTITQSYLNPAYVMPPPASPFTNPGVQGLSPDDRQALNDANRAAAMKAAAQAAVPQYLTRTIPNPAYKAPPLAFPTGGNVFANALNHTHLGGLLSLLGGGQNASDMLFGGNSTGIPPLPGGLSHIASSLATAQPGQTAYSAPGGGLVPLVTINGQPRTGSYGDSTMGIGGSLASRG